MFLYFRYLFFINCCFCLLDASNNKGTPFLWDIVVLTTVDELQKDCFEKQLQPRKEKGLLPQVVIKLEFVTRFLMLLFFHR